MNSPLSLDQARRALDKAQTVYQNTMLSNAVRGTTSADDAKRDSSEWQDAYYSSSTLKSFTDRFSKFYAKQFSFAKHAEPAYLAVVHAWKAYNIARLAEKARLAAKRVAAAAKSSLKAELNLQEGVSLKGVDVGQYKVILAGLEPVRLHVYAAQKKALQAEFEAAQKFLADNSTFTSRSPVYPAKTGDVQADRYAVRIANEKHNDEVERVSKWFSQSGCWTSFNGRSEQAWVERFASTAGRIEDSAQQFALAYVQGYAAKLAVKVGEVFANDHMLMQRTTLRVVGASVSTTNLWRDSIATIACEDDALPRFAIKFHTQIIWNRSCLGKVFNQYPTRRID